MRAVRVRITDALDDRHPAVVESAVVASPDRERGEIVKAFVVLRADTRTDGLHEALKEHVKQKIGPWKYPRWIEFVQSFGQPETLNLNL